MAATLVEQLGKEPVRATVITDCVNLIDSQVKSKGFMMKTAYATIKTVKAKFVPEVVDTMLDEWLDKLQPHYEKWQVARGSTTNTFADYVTARSEDVAEDLLSVTDKRAEKTSHTTVKKLYGKMRDSAKANVVEAIPALAKLIEVKLVA
jgi:spore coat protein CotH